MTANLDQVGVWSNDRSTITWSWSKWDNHPTRFDDFDDHDDDDDDEQSKGTSAAWGKVLTCINAVNLMSGSQTPTYAMTPPAGLKISFVPIFCCPSTHCRRGDLLFYLFYFIFRSKTNNRLIAASNYCWFNLIKLALRSTKA